MELKILNLDTVVNSGIREPELVNYDNLGFYKKKTTSKGLVDRCEYYLNYDAGVYSNLIAYWVAPEICIIDLEPNNHIFTGTINCDTEYPSYNRSGSDLLGFISLG